MPGLNDAGPKIDAGAPDAGGAAGFGGPGVVGVRIDSRLCDNITMSIVAPRAFNLGMPTPISGAASDDSGNEFAVRWSSSSGHFQDSTKAHTTFTCTELGVQTVTLLASNPDLCSDALAVALFCVNGADGGMK